MFTSAVIAGFVISIGCIANCVMISMGQPVIGAFLFSIGLISICIFKLNLFTGKVCTLLNKDNDVSALDLLIIYVGNFMGVVISTLFYCFTDRFDAIEDLCIGIADKKLNTPDIDLFFLGILCNICIYLAVVGYGKSNNLLIVILGVMVFTLVGAEHCIADVFYFSVGSVIEKFFGKLLCVTIGNLSGGLMMNILMNNMESH